MSEISPRSESDLLFAEEVAREPGCQHLWRCFACGVCTAVCPVSQVTPGFSPSRILRQILQGQRQELLHSEALWHCLGCSSCSFQCPQEVRGKDIIAALRALAQQEDVISPEQSVRLQETEGLLQALRRRVITAILAGGSNPAEVTTLVADCLRDMHGEKT